MIPKEICCYIFFRMAELIGGSPTSFLNNPSMNLKKMEWMKGGMWSCGKSSLNTEAMGFKANGFFHVYLTHV
jgi:hypothetical protein